MANVIEQVNRPTIVLAHNKTSRRSLYAEFKEFFPNNAVEYFVSYYDYYQPEAYVPRTDTFIEKDADINEEIISCATPPPERCSPGATSSWRRCRASMVWAPWNTRRRWYRSVAAAKRGETRSCGI